jgi:mono/diheme cytochrome c family protein
MRKALRWIGVGLSVLAVAVLAFVSYVSIDGVPHYARTPPELHVEVTPARVARGRALAEMLCVVCHEDPATQTLTGKRLPDVPPALGVAYSRNITRDPVHGIGAWSDGDIAYLLRTGVSRDGRYTPPWMVKLPRLSDEDLASVIAWLRSDDPRLAAQSVPNRVSEATFLTKFLMHVAWKPLAVPAEPIPDVPATDPVARGRYLATAALACYACHSGDITKVDEHTPEKSFGFFGGGAELTDAEGRQVLSPNITFDEETGIGKWTLTDFRRSLKEGFAPGNRPVRYPMERAPLLSDDDVAAIYAYLKTVPPRRHAVPRAPAPAVVAQAGEGERVYAKYQCRTCHGEAGMATCDLRTADAKYPHDEDLVGWIKRPDKRAPDTRMPSWDGVIADAEYAPLARYVRELGRRSAIAYAVARPPAHDGAARPSRSDAAT